MNEFRQSSLYDYKFSRYGTETIYTCRNVSVMEPKLAVIIEL